MAESNSDQPERHLVVCQLWIEHEKGWGTRPHGFTLHRLMADRERYVAEFTKDRNPRNVPDEYSSPEGNPYPLDVSTEVYETVKQSENGVWYPGKPENLS